LRAQPRRRFFVSFFNKNLQSIRVMLSLFSKPSPLGFNLTLRLLLLSKFLALSSLYLLFLCLFLKVIGC
jgi:hypothetical protein